MAIHTNEAYTWRATCHDGTPIPEFDAINTIGRGFAEVDGSQVKMLELLPTTAFEERTARVVLPLGATPVFFRRRRVELNPSTNEEKRSTTHCIGWRRGEQECYLFVASDGSALLTDDLQAV